MPHPREIVPGIWIWSTHDPARGIDFNGWYVERGDTAVVVDPPASDDALELVRGRRRQLAAILLTNKHHTRDAVRFGRELRAPLWVPAGDAALMDVPFARTYAAGDRLPCDLTAVAIRDGKTPGETALLAPGTGTAAALIVGDAVIGKSRGQLSMLPAAKFADVGAAIAGLRPLLELEFEALLLGDGEPIVRGGRAALARFVEKPPAAG